MRKYDSSGNHVWTRQFGTNSHDAGHGVAVNANGDVYVAGYTQGTLPGQTFSEQTDGFIRKYDQTGNVLWTRQFGSNDWEFIYAAALDPAGNIYVAGQTHGVLAGQSSQGGTDAFVGKYSPDGNNLWLRQFGPEGPDGVLGIASLDPDYVFVAGQTSGTFSDQNSAGGSDAFVGKYDASGGQLWVRQFGSNATDSAYGGVASDPDGNIYVVGYTYGSLPGYSGLGDADAFVRKYNNNGTLADELSPTATPTLIPGVSGAGLLLMAGLLLASGLWTLRGHRRRIGAP